MTKNLSRPSNNHKMIPNEALLNSKLISKREFLSWLSEGIYMTWKWKLFYASLIRMAFVGVGDFVKDELEINSNSTKSIPSDEESHELYLAPGQLANSISAPLVDLTRSGDNYFLIELARQPSLSSQLSLEGTQHTLHNAFITNSLLHGEKLQLAFWQHTPRLLRRFGSAQQQAFALSKYGGWLYELRTTFTQRGHGFIADPNDTGEGRRIRRLLRSFNALFTDGRKKMTLAFLIRQLRQI